MHSIALRLLCEKEESSEQKLTRRRLRDESNPLELSEPTFKQYYRLNKAAFKYLLDLLISSLPPSKQKFAIPPIVKLSAALRFFAEGGYQKGVGKDHEVALSQSSFSEVLTEVLGVLEPLLCPEWIKWPNVDEQREIALDFYGKHRIPGVVGCIDGTHVNIISPSTNKHLFYNRKGSCSLNVLLVSFTDEMHISTSKIKPNNLQLCDNQLKIRFIDATHPGACHDSFIWNVSDLRSKMEQDFLHDRRNVWLLGDAGHPLEPWLLIPYRSPENGSQNEKFNYIHAQCRNIIERTNGVLKNRWRCLLSARQLHYTPSKSIKIINVCAALQNICIYYKVGGDFFQTTNSEDFDVNLDQNSQPTETHCSYLTVGQRIRTNITSAL